MADFLKRDAGRNIWQARLDVPASVRHAFDNKRVLTKALGTSDKTEAKRRAAIVVARWRAMFRKAGAAQDPLRAEAERWRAWIASTETGEPDDLTPTLLSNRAEQIERDHGSAAAQMFARTADGRAVMIDAVADRWLEWKQYPARSDYHHRRHLALLLQHHKEVASVDRRAASKFTADILQPGRDGATVIKMISTYRGLWKFLKREDIVTGENPWADLGPARQGTVKGVRSINGGSKRRAFTETEAQQLLGTMTGVDLDVAQVLAVSGMRLEEVTQMAPGDVNERGGVVWVEVKASKTAAGLRRVPIVDPQVTAMLRARAALGREAVFHELPVDRFGDRSRQLSQRMGHRLRHDLGIVDPALASAHSWRHRARTLMEGAGVPPWTSDWIMGHQRGGEGLSRYSKPSDEQLIAAARAIPLPV